MAASSTDAKLAEVIERVFRMTLTAPGDDAASASARGDRPLYLESLAQELVMEGAEPPFAVSPDQLERALFARLSTPTDQLGSWSSDPEAAPVRWLCIVHDRRDEKEFASRSDALRANRTERETRASRREEAREAVVRRASARTTRARSEMDRRGGRARARGRRATATAT
jgi:hypothetical protein